MRARRPLLLPLVPLYAAALSIKQKLFERVPVRYRLTQPVLSVGSLSAGGAGKTPVVEALAGLLTRYGYAVDVLSRGYGRATHEVQRVDPLGTSANFGDEPLLLARRTQMPVYVGADRYAAGLMAEKEHGQGIRLVHLLDDGFQHRRLARDLDVILLTQEDVEDRLLPAGNLREPLHRLQSADVVVLREEEEASLRSIVSELASAAHPVWVIQRQMEMLSLNDNVPQRPLVFCGIARPENLFHMLRCESTLPAHTIAFPDHHAYRDRDIDRLLEEAHRSGANGFVTTEKDAVKLSDQMRSRLETIGPMTVARLTVTFRNEDKVIARIQAAIEQPSA